MKCFRMCGLVSVVVWASLGVVVASASAAATLPSLLPAGTAASPLGFTSSSGESSFGNGILEVKSTKSKGTSTGFSAKLGAFRWLLEKTGDILGENCTGLASGEEVGSITVTGTYHIRDAKETVGTALTLVVAITFLILPVHFTCGTATLVIETGCVAGLLHYAAPKGKEATVVLEKVSGKNDNKIIKVLNEENTAEENCELKSSENEGTAALSSVRTSQVWSGFSKEGVQVEPEVMPL